MRSAARPPQPRHVPAALASIVAVLALHGWLLTAVPPAPGPWRGEHAAPARSLQVRQLILAPGAPDRVAPPAPPRPATRRDAATTAAKSPAAPPAVTDTATDAATDRDLQAPAPLYATRLPPPATLQYRLRRGAASGDAVLHWLPAADRYALSLRGHLAGARPVGWDSQGAIDAHGIAPDRYTESRRGRELRAANFQRDSARITFSGPRLEYALPPAAQDRLSWMLQLGAVIAADPDLAAPGRALRLFVVGSRGDAEVWTFTVQGHDDIELPDAGLLPTLRLRREPRLPYDTLVQVWLDPARHHLPVRVELTDRVDTTEFVLEQLSLP